MKVRGLRLAVLGLVWVTSAVGWAGAPAPARTAGKRPAVDLAAMREAMGSQDTGVSYPSAASYAHFLKARLSHHAGDHRRALDELRLALASDESSPYLLTELGEQFARGADLERAQGQLKQVIERYPDYAPAQLLYGRVLVEANKPGPARQHLQKAIKLRPTDPEAYLVTAQVFLDQGKLDEAMKVVEDLGAAVPGEPVGYRRLGLALAERGDAARAEKMLLKATERDAGDLEAWATLARIYEATERYPQAADALERAVERDPENRELLLAAGRVALRLDRAPEAKAAFEQLLSLGKDPEWVVKVAFSYLALHQLEAAAGVLDGARADTRQPRLHFYAGLVRERLRQWGAAADAFDQVPPDATELALEAQLHRAMCLSSQGKHGPALALFKRLTDQAPTLPGLDLAFARALERAGRTKDAEALLVKAVGASPGPETLEAVTGFYQRQHRLGEGVDLLRGALVKAPRDEALLFALALATQKAGDWEGAVTRMRALLAQNPTHAGACNFVGYTLAEHDASLDEAQRLVQRALDAKPDSPAYLDSMGWVLYKRGEFERAAGYLERAVAGAPDEATLWEHLAEVALKLGRTPQAQDDLGRALRLLAENPEAADRPGQRADLEKKLKLLSTRQKAR